MTRHRQSKEQTIRVWAVRPILLPELEYSTCFGTDSLGRDPAGNSAHKAPFLLRNHHLRSNTEVVMVGMQEISETSAQVT